MLQAHFFDFLSKTFSKREQFIFVTKENNGLLSSNGGSYTFAKLVLFRLLVLVVLG